jgi:hypothetical protein
MTLSDKLEEIKNEMETMDTWDPAIYDIGDVGNAIGGIIGRDLTVEQLNLFLGGLDHGISTQTGLHCGQGSQCGKCRSAPGYDIDIQATWNGRPAWQVEADNYNFYTGNKPYGWFQRFLWWWRRGTYVPSGVTAQEIKKWKENYHE